MSDSIESKILIIDTENFSVFPFIGFILMIWWTYSGAIPPEVTVCLVAFSINGVTINFKKIINAIST